MSSPEPFLPLFLETQSDLRAFIGSVVRDPIAREDIFQEVSLVLWKSFSKYDPTRSFGAWARGIAIRKIMESRRQLARLPDSLTEEVLDRVSAAFESPENHTRAQQERALEQCVEQLPPKSGKLFSERYGRGRSIEELATEVGLSVDAIYQSLSRIRRLLRECVSRRVTVLNR
jgi:RNA polymerase sigma-70 factor, ECF subfamily